MTLYDKIYSDFIQARKDKKELDKNILALLYNNLKNKMIELKTNTLDDTNTSTIIKKLVKQLDEEIVYNVKANKVEMVNTLTYQKNLIQNYLPKQLSEDEIKNILNTLEDKSIPSVMKYFKINYNGLVDMGLVSKLARQ